MRGSGGSVTRVEGCPSYILRIIFSGGLLKARGGEHLKKQFFWPSKGRTHRRKRRRRKNSSVPKEEKGRTRTATASVETVKFLGKRKRKRKNNGGEDTSIIPEGKRRYLEDPHLCRGSAILRVDTER